MFDNFFETGRPIDFVFDSIVRFSGTAGRLELHPVVLTAASGSKFCSLRCVEWFYSADRLDSSATVMTVSVKNVLNNEKSHCA